VQLFLFGAGNNLELLHSLKVVRFYGLAATANFREAFFREAKAN
jgi:hypothetical protein